MRSLLAASLFAIGSSFVLLALKGGDQALAAASAMAASSTAAMMIRALRPGQLVEDLADAGHPASSGGHVLGGSRVRGHTL